MHFKIRQIGNSSGIIFPNTLLKKYNLHNGDDLESREVDDSIILTLAKPIKKYKLEDLIAQCDSNARWSDEEKQWFSLPDVGVEKV